MAKGGTATIGGGPGVGGPALGAKPGGSINKAFIGGNGVEAGGRGGQAAAQFSIAKSLESSPLRVGLNKSTIGAEKMTVIGGKPVEIRPGPAQWAASPNIGSERFTAQTGHMFQRRADAASVRRTTPDATNNQLEKALGTRIGEFHPTAPKGPDIIQRGNGKYSLPPENAPARPADTKVREAALVRKIHEAYARGPEVKPKVESGTQKSDLQTPVLEKPSVPIRPAEIRQRPDVKTSPKPQSPNIARIMAELNRIGERTKQQAAAKKAGTVTLGSMAEYQNLDKQVVSLKKEADKKGGAKAPVEQALGLLNRRNEARALGDAGVAVQKPGNPFEALSVLIRKKIHDAEEEANVIPLRPTDPKKPGIDQPEKKVGELAPVIGIGNPAGRRIPERQRSDVTFGSLTQIRPAEIDEPQPLRVAQGTELPQAAPARLAAKEQDVPQSEKQPENVIYLADRRSEPVPRPAEDIQPAKPEPKKGPPNSPEGNNGSLSVDDNALTVRVNLGLVSAAEEAARLNTNEVDGYDIVKNIDLHGASAKSKIIRDVPQLVDGSALVTETNYRSLRRVPLENARTILRAAALKAPPVSYDPPGTAATQADYERVIKGVRAIA